ncbi:MAG: HmuY family protein [Treponema sp.]|jgi:hypothetical protein|nr:HmuY family protein [Treponema sp.]
MKKQIVAIGISSILLLCGFVVIGCPNDTTNNEDTTPSYAKEGEITFEVDSSNGPRFFSLTTGEWVDASESGTQKWDIAFQRMRKIYTNSGTSAEAFSSNGKGGVWYTNKTDFDAVTSKDDAVTDLSSILAPYTTDQSRYTGTSSGSLARINLMTYMGYINEATASGITADDFLMYPSGEGAAYLPTAFYDIDQKETEQVYIIKHADGETYSKIQVYDFEFISSSVAPSGLGTDSYKVRYAVFK